MCIIKKSGNAQPLKEIEVMKYLECEYGKIQFITYVAIHSLFSFEISRKLEYLLKKHTVIGYEKTSLSVNSSHFLYKSSNFEERAQYRRQLQHDTDIEPAWAINPNKARHSVLIEGG